MRTVPGRATEAQSGTLVNDIHSRLNPTVVEAVIEARKPQDVAEAVRQARRRKGRICVSGGRHAMGAQQFATAATLIDMRALNGVGELSASEGTVEVEAGIQWPDLIEQLLARQYGWRRQLGIRQKQTGADNLTVGGALSANIHGRGLRMRPFIADVEALTVVHPSGEVLRLTRDENGDLFRLVIGGYGLFGIITSVRLRLARRRRLVRRVREIRSGDLVAALESAAQAGYLYGDFQFAIDSGDDSFLDKGILSLYEPADDGAGPAGLQKKLSSEQWRRLAYLAHHDKSLAYATYKGHYLATDGQVYWSDTHQLSTYLEDYHSVIQAGGGAGPSSEVITELYVPREALSGFLASARDSLRAHRADVIYGTIRLIERDGESFLPWARDNYACVIFNLHVEHSVEALARAAHTFRALIDLAIARGGSYYLTYHRYASAAQLLSCYPEFPEFLRLKAEHDPEALLASDWHDHHRQLLDARGTSADHPAQG